MKIYLEDNYTSAYGLTQHINSKAPGRCDNFENVISRHMLQI